jgi:hypothetical protein
LKKPAFECGVVVASCLGCGAGMAFRRYVGGVFAA